MMVPVPELPPLPPPPSHHHAEKAAIKQWKDSLSLVSQTHASVHPVVPKPTPVRPEDSASQLHSFGRRLRDSATPALPNPDVRSRLVTLNTANVPPTSSSRVPGATVDPMALFTAAAMDGAGPSPGASASASASAATSASRTHASKATNAFRT